MRRGNIAAEVVLAVAVVAAAAPQARADYAVLRSGTRLHITGYERRGASYVLELAGGQALVPAGEIAGFEPEDTFQKAAPQSLPVPYSRLIAQAAVKHGVDERLVAGVIAAESNFQPRTVSPKGARGLMQLMRATAARYGSGNVFDPGENIDAGTRYLGHLLTQYRQNATLALAAYNAGPERVMEYGGVPPFAETRAYIERVQQTAAKLTPTRAPSSLRAMVCRPEQRECRESSSESSATRAVSLYSTR